MSDPASSELEIRIAYQDDTIASLSEQLYRQAQQIDRLAEQMRRLEQQITQWRENEGTTTDDAPPPHY